MEIGVGGGCERERAWQGGRGPPLQGQAAWSWEAAGAGVAGEVRVDGRNLCRVDGRSSPILAQQIQGVWKLERTAAAGCGDVHRGLEIQQEIECFGSVATQLLITIRQDLPCEAHFPRGTRAQRLMPNRGCTLTRR